MKVIKPIKQILDEFVKNRRWEKNFALGLLKKDWQEVVGKNIAKHTAPKYVKAKKLYIEVDSPIWSTQLNFLKDQVIRTINSYYDKELIKDIFFNIKKE